jgi:hypothetical protein
VLTALPLTEKENANLSLSGVMAREVGRVQKGWGSRVCLWDPRFLRLSEDDATEDAARLTFVLDQFAKFGARVVPVVGLTESYHRVSAIGEHAARTGSGAAVRLNFDEIQDFELLHAQVANLRLPANECVLLIDLTDADLSEHDEFAKSLVTWLFALREQGNWRKIVVIASGYPLKNPAQANSNFSVTRTEWKIWEWALALEPSLNEFVIFGDFGADNSVFKFGGGGRPIPHLRYATETEWLVARGGQFYSTVREVSQRIVASAVFKGRDYSFGDEFIADCASGLVGTSDPTHWRAVNMNHHMTVVVRQFAAIYRVHIADRQVVRAQQVDLFDLPAPMAKALATA